MAHLELVFIYNTKASINIITVILQLFKSTIYKYKYNFLAPRSTVLRLLGT